MKRTICMLALATLVVSMMLVGAACSPKPTVAIEDLVGSYEGEWAMSPMMKPVASLILTPDNKYEFFLSIMGLMEEGSFEIKPDYVVNFTPTGGKSAIKGKYEEGTLKVAFSIDNKPAEITYTQVGTPQDVYKSFLGDYLTKVMGRTEVLLSLRPDRKYVNSLSHETGTFKITNGQITLTPNDENATSVTGSFDVSSHQMVIEMSVMPGTPKAELTYDKVPPEDMLVYCGISSVGMSGTTPVQLTFKPGNAFEIKTSSPRGVGVYEVNQKDGKFELVLTYIDPAARPDGTEFKLVGTTQKADLSAPGNTIKLTVEYIVNMDGPSVMNLGEVQFELPAK